MADLLDGHRRNVGLTLEEQPSPAYLQSLGASAPQGMQMFAVVALVVALLAAFPTTIGRGLNKLLVETPARRLNTLSPGRIAFYAALGTAGLILFGLFEAEGLRLFSLFTPELILWFGMFDVALFLDVFILAAALGATSRIRAARAALVHSFRLVWTPGILRSTARTRAPRSPRPARPAKPSADPDPTSDLGAFAFA